MSVAAPEEHRCRAIVTDIEGTTSSIAFVKEVLFPFAQGHLRAFLSAHSSEPEVMACLSEARTIAGDPSLTQGDLADLFLGWIASDKKVTPLKTLQGLIWADGYATGELQGHIYDDAADKLSEWHLRGHALYVFSSGSIAAQKLLFARSRRGDLTPLFSGYFDTTTGSKIEDKSYSIIAAAIGRAPGDIVFLSDHHAELDAAARAGLRTACLDRGEAVIPEGIVHPRYKTFTEIDPERV